MTETSPQKPHHHGNLRAALVDAGIALLEQGDPLTLRKCAARAGVSHAAPAHHFDGVQGLKAAIASRGFETFRDFMRAASETSPQTPRDRLKAICRGYLGFGLAHPALFHLIFGFAPGSSRARTLATSDAGTYQMLADSCAPFVPPGTDPAILEVQVWSLIHGFTMLVLDGQFCDPETGQIGDGPIDAILALIDRVGIEPANRP